MGESAKRHDERAFARIARRCLELYGGSESDDYVTRRVARFASLEITAGDRGFHVNEANSMRLVYAETAEGYWAGHNSKLLKKYLAELIQLMPLEALADV